MGNEMGERWTGDEMWPIHWIAFEQLRTLLTTSERREVVSSDQTFALSLVAIVLASWTIERCWSRIEGQTGKM